MNTVKAASKAEIDLVHALLEKKFGQLYADIWKVGVNLSLRISDLLTLEYQQLNLEDRSLQITEQKTGKQKLIRLNSAAIDESQFLLVALFVFLLLNTYLHFLHFLTLVESESVIQV